MSFTWSNNGEPSLAWLHQDVVWLDGAVRVRKNQLTSLKETFLREVVLEIIFDNTDVVKEILGDDFSVWSKGEMLIVQWHIIDGSESTETELDIEDDRLQILANLFGEERATSLGDHVEDMILDERYVSAQIERIF